jgi:hypothetical protein
MADIEEFVLVGPRARRMPPQMYSAGIVVKGTENLKNPQFVVYSSNTGILKKLVDSHNELIRVKKGTK